MAPVNKETPTHLLLAPLEKNNHNENTIWIETFLHFSSIRKQLQYSIEKMHGANIVFKKYMVQYSI